MPDTAPMLELRDVEVRFSLKRSGLFGAIPPVSYTHLTLPTKA